VEYHGIAWNISEYLGPAAAWSSRNSMEYRGIASNIAEFPGIS
jgi:hypothetical protein